MKMYFLLLFLSSHISVWSQSVFDLTFAGISENNRPGFIVTILEDNSVAYQRAIGYSSVKNDIQVNPDTRFAIASCSKQFTAYCIFLLEQNNQLQLTDDICKYIPELNYPKGIQIKHLLSHTSGIRDHIEMLGWKNNQKEAFYSFEGTLRILQKFNGMSFTPGENFAYSNTGYMLLGLIIERISGMKLNDFAQKHIFIPLNMSNTEFSFRRKYKEYGKVDSYKYNPDKNKFNRFNYLEVNALGATGVYTTVNDYTKWNQFLCSLNDSVKSKLFTSDTLVTGNLVQYNYGFIFRNYKQYKTIDHSGGWANFNFQYTMIPELNKSIIIASNNEFDYPIGIAEQLLKEIIPNDRDGQYGISANIETLTTGQYISSDFMACNFEKSGGQSEINGEKLYGGKRYKLYGQNDVYIDSAYNGFHPIDDSSFLWSGGAYFNTSRLFKFNKDITDEQLLSFNGTYFSKELGKMKFKFNPKNKKIIIKTSFGQSPKIIERKNRLLTTNGSYSLYLNENNTITIGNSRVFNVVFQKTRL